MLTKNSSARLAEVLSALQWCDEVVIFDTGSTDATLSIAAGFSNVSLHQLTGEFPGFGLARQYAISLARHDWILAIDSDEVVSPELATEIRELKLDPRSVYVVPFQNYFAGRQITTCGWAPDRHERLFNRTVTKFCDSEVHERLQTRGLKSVTLRHSIRHYSYRDTADFVRKMGTYSQLFARQNAGKRRSSAAKAVTRSGWAFFKSYVLERGFLQGAEGLLISAYKSQTVFWKYMMLREANAARAK
jgi:glycosyltransferase involved in cell wall biosynthesis